MTGKFYGIGLGPGDPGLVTVKAVEVLRSVGVIYSAGSRQSSRSVSGGILEAISGITARRVELEFTMSRDFRERLARIDEHARQILLELRAGRDVAFAVIGDSLTYGTCGYLLRSLRRQEPDLSIEIIPGVNSWSATSAVVKQALVEDREELRIIPVALGVDPEELATTLPKHGTAVLLKCYRGRDKLIAQLIKLGYGITYAANVGLDTEFVSSDPEEIATRPEEYLAMLLVRSEASVE